jgi:hypothetical protein
MGLKHRICNYCNKEYFGQGKYFCSLECKGKDSKGKKQNFSPEHLKFLSYNASIKFKNKTRSEETKSKISKKSKEFWNNMDNKLKMSNIKKGHFVSNETKEKISKKQKGIQRPYVSLNNKMRISPKGWKHTNEWKLKMSLLNKGENNGMYGKKPKYGKNILFVDKNNRSFNFRSSWEKIFAEWLDKNNVFWEYELLSYPLSNGTTYRPDFFTEDFIYEIKGYKHKISMDKFFLFKKEYPFIKIELIDRQKMKELKLL